MPTIVWNTAPMNEPTSWMDDLPQAQRKHLQQWQGVWESMRYIWFGDTSKLSHELPQQQGATNLVKYKLTDGKHWGATIGDYANFVLRELQLESLDDILPDIHQQIDRVFDYPGCTGCALYAKVDHPAHLLGVTYWQEVSAFEQYGQWGSAHPWKDTITPITVHTPLRLFCQAVNLLDDPEG